MSERTGMITAAESGVVIHGCRTSVPDAPAHVLPDSTPGGCVWTI
jgi:hypothetical protein